MNAEQTDLEGQRQEILASADTDQRLRVLLKAGLLGFLEDDEATSDFLHLVFADDIKAHNESRCYCDLTDGGYGFCYVGQWYEGCRDAWEVITEMESDYVADCFRGYFRAL